MAGDVTPIRRAEGPQGSSGLPERGGRRSLIESASPETDALENSEIGRSSRAPAGWYVLALPVIVLLGLLWLAIEVLL